MENTDIIAILALILALLLMLSVFRLKKRVTELESQLAQRDAYGEPAGNIGAAAGRTASIPTPLFVQNPEIAPDLERRLHLLLAEGKKIQAIKVIREARNLSLKDAKDFIDNLEQGGPFR
jgi:large subunit ribosomal protein L7/L12